MKPRALLHEEVHAVAGREALAAALMERDRVGMRLMSLRRAAQFGEADWAEIKGAVARYHAAVEAIDAAVADVWMPLPQDLPNLADLQHITLPL